MIKEIFGKKIGMTQMFSPEGELIPATVVEVEPACVLEKITYPNKQRAKIGCFKIKDTKVSKVKKPQKGYFEKIGVPPYKLVKEVEIEKDADFSFSEESEKKPESAQAKVEKKEVHQPENIGNAGKEEQSQKETLQGSKDDSVKEQDKAVKKEQDKEEAKEDKKENNQAKETVPEEGKQEDKSLDKGQTEEEKKTPSRYLGVEIFSQGQLLTVRSKTKGKGFAGAIKRHNMQRQPSSHGSGMHRRVGSVGPSATPSKIAKNKKMPGHLGAAYRVTKNLKVLKVDKEKKVIFIRGNISGSKGAIVRLTKQNQ